MRIRLCYFDSAGNPVPFIDFSGDAGDTTWDVGGNALTGWIGKGGTGLVFNKDQRPLSNGAFRRTGYRTGRTISWSGHLYTDSPEKQDHEMARLSGMFSEGVLGRVIVDSAFGTHWIDAQIDENPAVDRIVYGELASYEVNLWAPDPEIFGETHTYPPGAVYHYGNHPAVGTAVVTGPQAAPYTLAVGGRQFIVTQALTSGQTHEVDTARGRVYRNGVLQGSVYSKAQSLIVASGSDSTFTGPSNSVLKVVDTFM